MEVGQAVIEPARTQHLGQRQRDRVYAALRGYSVGTLGVSRPEPGSSDDVEMGDVSESSGADLSALSGSTREVVRLILRGLPHDVVLVIDAELRVLFGSGRLLERWGLDLLVPRADIEAVLAPDLAAGVASASRKALQGMPCHDDVRVGQRIFLLQVRPLDELDARDPSAVLVLLQDVTESRRSDAGLRESERQLRLTIDNAPIGEAIVELDGRWRRANPALTHLTGYTESELLEMTFQDITHPDDLALDLDLLAQLVAGDIESYQMEKRYFTASGSTVWVLLCVALVRGEDDEPLYFVSQILDITHRKAQEAALRDLTSMLAHDLRLPSTVISSYAELLLSEGDSLTESGRQGVIRRLARAASTLEGLLDNALTAAALDAQGAVPVTEHVDVELVAREVMAAVPHPGVSMSLTVRSPTHGWMDPVHLERALSNVVSNAVKYGGDRVTLTLDEVDGRAEVRVADHGVGVPAEFVPRLFERFSRSDDARTGQQRGSGLGLHIVQSLMRLNAGTVAYAPTPGGGATFILDFPARQPT